MNLAQRMQRRDFLRLAGAGAASSWLPGRAQATWPSQPVKLLVGYPPGGPTDVTMRLLADNATKLLGQQVLVENRPGAAAALSTQQMVQSKPDGHTLAHLPLTVLRLPHVQQVGWDPIKGISYIIGIAAYTFGMSVPADSVLKTWTHFVGWTKANPGALSYGSHGVLSITHLTMEDIAQRLGTEFNHIPYKGSVDMMQAVLGGQIMVAPDAIGGFAPHVQAGKLRVLNTWGEQRASKGMNPALIGRIHDVFKQAMEMPNHMEALARFDLRPMHMNPRQYAQFAQETFVKEKALIEKLGFAKSSS